MAVSKLLLIKFGNYHKLESCGREKGAFLFYRESSLGFKRKIQIIIEKFISLESIAFTLTKIGKKIAGEKLTADH